MPNEVAGQGVEKVLGPSDKIGMARRENRRRSRYSWKMSLGKAGETLSVDFVKADRKLIFIDILDHSPRVESELLRNKCRCNVYRVSCR